MMENKMDYDDFKEDFGEWAKEFKPFIESKEFFDIYQKIKADAAKEIIVPASDDTFRAFRNTPRSSIKSIWYMMDPYAKRYKDKTNQATGIAMDCSHTPDGHLQPSLELFYEGIADDLKRKRIERNPSLEYLCKQGVLLTNTDLTCKLNKTASHNKLWEPFQKYFLEEIMAKQIGIVYVLSGKESERMEQYIQPIGNYIFKIEHPVAASYSNRQWNYQGIFQKTNKILIENIGQEIIWNKEDYDKRDELPF